MNGTAESTAADMIDTALGPLAVMRHGEQGRWVLLWHSLFVDGRSWDAVWPALAGRRVLVVDGPCHGRSPGPGRRFSIEACAEAALAVLDHVGAAEVDWIGNAWGGHVGVALATRAPERVRSLAAICSPMDALRFGEKIPLWGLAAIFRVTGWTDWLAGKIAGALLLDTAPAEARRYLKEAAGAPGAERTRLAMQSVMFGRRSLLANLGRIQTPTLFVTTDGNKVWSRAQAEAQAKLLPHGRVEILTGARHLPPIEIPAKTAALCQAWLKEHDAI